MSSLFSLWLKSFIIFQLEGFKEAETCWSNLHSIVSLCWFYPLNMCEVHIVSKCVVPGMWEVNVSSKNAQMAWMFSESPLTQIIQWRCCAVYVLSHVFKIYFNDYSNRSPENHLRGVKLKEKRLVTGQIISDGWFLESCRVSGCSRPPLFCSLLKISSQKLIKLSVGVMKATSDRISCALTTVKCLITLCHSIRDDTPLSAPTEIQLMDQLDVPEKHNQVTLSKYCRCHSRTGLWGIWALEPQSSG